MCGIAGLITSSSDQNFKKNLSEMTQSLAHRGPDDQGLEFFQCGYWSVGLGHTRLAVLDLSTAGHQPMQIENGSLWMSYNGEIYNYRELRQSINNCNIHWQSQTDTEVMLRCYQRWGLDALKEFRGMFALALWDPHKKQLLLARDPFGIKPLYYFKSKDTFLFSSEIRAILKTGLVSRCLDQQGLISYLQYGSVQDPSTIIEGIQSLLPGHYLIVDLKDEFLQIREVSYLTDLFSSAPIPESSDYHESMDRLRELLKESVRLHLVSDVPLGVFLSGGIDSSALVALMNEVAKEPPKTFCVVFDEEKDYSEKTYARIIADKFQADHREISLSEKGILNILPNALNAMDQPTMDGINTYIVAKAVKESGVTVALSGLGGDELFAGYPSFLRALRMEKIRRIPVSLRIFASKLGSKFLSNSYTRKKFWALVGSEGDPEAAYRISRQLFAVDEIQNLLNEPYFPDALSEQEDIPDSIYAVSVRELQGYMSNTLLRDTDCMSMAHALEVRVPFVDSMIVRFVLNLPGKWKINGNRPKPLLLDVMKNLLPEAIWRRPKMGFILPFERWLRTSLYGELNEIYRNVENLKRLGFQANFARDIWRTFQERPHKERWSRSWALYVLMKWCEINEIESFSRGRDFVGNG